MDMSTIGMKTRAADKTNTFKRMTIMLVLIATAVGAVLAYKTISETAQQKILQSESAVAQIVSAAKAETQTWTPQLEAVGTLRAVNGADLSLELSGIVAEINFTSGQDVAAGQVLLRLRNDDDVAKLHSLESLATLAQLTYKRSLELVKTQAVSQATLDANAANLQNTEAQVAQQRAIVDKRVMRAPFSGRLGLRAVDRGQYVNAGTTVVTLQSLDPIFLDFYLPQQQLDIIRVGQSVKVKVDTYPGEVFDGEISAINPKVDPANRNVAIRATLKNTEHKLFPGMFATTTVGAGDASTSIALPQTAIVYSPYGDAVYLVEQKDAQGPVARFAFVTLGRTRGDMVAIMSGVKQGDLIVTAGQVKLHNGSRVKIDNSVRPSTDLNPTPRTR